jgi:hypothetical protein
MSPQKRYAEGYATGWASVLGPQLVLSEIPSPPTQASGSDYILGLLTGIAAARKCAEELSTAT